MGSQQSFTPPKHIHPSAFEVFPKTLTLLVTYRCNAECAQCCFESNPNIVERLSLEQICAHITSAKASFPALKIVVFSGGECFLLKDDLFSSIEWATQKGLMTRCVTNGFWGKTIKHAERITKQLISSGLTEINFSTGSDHQEWVPFASVENAARATVEAGIRTVVTVETDSSTSNCVKAAAESSIFKNLLNSSSDLFNVITNIWMPFNNRWDKTRASAHQKSLGPCDQVFGNIVVTPHNLLSACCGLTLEHIPEMKIADLATTPLGEGFESQFEDFLKIWIHVDGPSGIIEKLFPEEAYMLLASSIHICQACAVLHQHPQVRARLKEKYINFVPDVLARFNAKIAVAEKISRLTAVKH